MVLYTVTLLFDYVINRIWLNQIGGYPIEFKQDIIELTGENKKVNETRKIEELK